MPFAGVRAQVFSCRLQVCVHECPDKYWEWYSQYAAEEVDENDVEGRRDMICVEGVDPLTDGRVCARKTVNDKTCSIKE